MHCESNLCTQGRSRCTRKQCGFVESDSAALREILAQRGFPIDAAQPDQPIATPEQAESWTFWLVVLAAILFVLVLVLSASDFHFAR